MSESAVEDQISNLSVESLDPSSDTITALVRRIRLLTHKLLPLEVPESEIQDPTSRIITPQVINAYVSAAGDFTEALPYCLLRARKEFMWDAEHNPADYEENIGRAMACEVLARRVVHHAPPDQLTRIMSARFRHREIDGDESGRVGTLEMAVDSHCTVFLSSSEAQDVVKDLWAGRLVQVQDADGDANFVPYKEHGHSGFLSHLDYARINVPRYQNYFRIVIWFFFLFAYSQAVREPLDKLDPNHSDLDEWEIVMYVLTLAFSFEDVHKIIKLLVMVSWRAFGFWNVVSFVTDALLITAFTLRIAGIAHDTGDQESVLRTRSFQCLSFAAPLLWMKLITVSDGYQFIGTMQICVARMLKESGIFLCLLAVLGIGFLQGLYALDAADGQTDHPSTIFNVLVQALLQAPNYDMFNPSPAGLALYYLWNVVTAVILLNVLISLFSSAYEDVVEDAAAEYLTYFAGKVIGMIRAPDEFNYPPPFNLIEIFLIAPWEFFVSTKSYKKLNRYVMTVVFFIPLSLIAFYEAEIQSSNKGWVRDWFSHPDQGAEGAPEFQDPIMVGTDAERGLEISKVKFEEIVKKFPNTLQSNDAVIIQEIKDLKTQLAELKELLVKNATGGEK